MSRPEMRLQVALTGARLAPCSDEELLARIQTRFKVSQAQSAAMLKGRVVVKRGIDDATAKKLVAVLGELGLEARVEVVPAPPPAPAAQAVARQAAPTQTSLTTIHPRQTVPAQAVPARAAAQAQAAAPIQSAPAAVAPIQAAPPIQVAPAAVAPTQAAPPIQVTPAPVVPTQAAAPIQAVPLPVAPTVSTPERPTPPPAPAGPLDALTALAGQRLPKPRTSFSYMVGLFVVTLLCVALPALYIGLTGGIAYGWFWYLTHIHEHLPRNGQLIALMYAVPGFVGAMLVLFLVRPLFASRPPPKEGLRLDPEKEAAFVSGVHTLCRAVGVSPPSEIRLSWDANASVHFHTRWLSLFTGRKVLTIGMSLVAGLSARQFVGVLAHEFGHFAQRFGMICSFTVNSVNAWLEHRAYGEDSWDRKLHEWSDAAVAKEHWFSGVVNLSVAASWIAIAMIRRLMAGLFHVSLRLSRYMSREMEFDADRYEALLAGSGMFRITARTLRALNHAFVEVNRANIEAWQEQRLLADIPEAVAVHVSEFGTARLTKIEQEMREETTTRYWDSHPPDVARIDNAEKLRLPGIYLVEMPAALLFKDFAGWSQRATRRFYAEQGVDVRPEQLFPREEILGDMRKRARQREQINRFFNGQFQDWPLFPLRAAAAADAQQPSWQDCIDRLRTRSPEMARNWLQAFQAYESRPLLRAAVKLSASSRDMGLPGAERSAQELGVELGDIAGHRMPFDKPLAEGFALYVQRVWHAIDSMPPREREEATRLCDTLIAIGALERDVSALEETAGAMRIFGSIAESNGEMPGGFDLLEANFGDCASQLLARADRIPQTVTAGGTVGAYLRVCCRDLPSGITVGHEEFARAAWPMPAAFHRLYLMALGELVRLCEAAEKGSGIRPIRLVA